MVCVSLPEEADEEAKKVSEQQWWSVGCEQCGRSYQYHGPGCPPFPHLCPFCTALLRVAIEDQAEVAAWVASVRTRRKLRRQE
jgi:hypothetical protein